ncbi:hypothetical protein FRC08_013394, partial [Ceratobasidium sp. 394]
EIQDAVKARWMKDDTFFGAGAARAIPKNMELPLIVSRKRTHTLGDMVNRLRRDVLNYSGAADAIWAKELNPNWSSDLI